MKTIGLIGGMSWESTALYYKTINETVKQNLGAIHPASLHPASLHPASLHSASLHSAKILLYSVDFAEFERYQAEGDWQKAGERLAGIALNLQKGGADFIALCTNTMHKCAPAIESAIDVPFLHIAEVTADELLKNGVKTVLLLGTKYTMTQDFYKQILIDRGINVLVPDSGDIEIINDVTMIPHSYLWHFFVFCVFCKHSFTESLPKVIAHYNSARFDICFRYVRSKLQHQLCAKI